MNKLTLQVIAARIEAMFPGEATDLRRIALSYEKMERSLDEITDDARESAQAAEAKALQANAIYLANRRSRVEMKRLDKLEATIISGSLLANHDVSADLQRIRAEWASNQHP